ncbi:hypothetical protein [Amycolatopsis sp. NPDC051102]|uniref:hypothetical protein n=1 Tax=Amycolatopsis sp. NPDC051102 TaxID=3155163 RepID=UPI00343947D5
MTTRANRLPAPRRGRPLRTAFARATGRHRTFLIATCVALVLAAIADEATGYDGPGPFIYPAFAVLIALLPWRFTPLFVVAMSALFIFGGLESPEFVHRLTTPGQALNFAAAWLQMLGFAAAAGFAVAAVVVSHRAAGSRS